MSAERRELFKVTKVEFIFGLANLERIPKQRLPEVMILGRSNVGKSSLINRLVGQKIAKTSSEPGCTKQLNFFRIEVKAPRLKFQFVLVDVPGFGYAKFSKIERERLSRLTVDYLISREQLVQVLLLSDVRRVAGSEEQAIQEICSDQERSCWVILTKADQLKRSETSNAVQKAAGSYGLESTDVIVTGKDDSLETLWSRLAVVIEDLEEE